MEITSKLLHEAWDQYHSTQNELRNAVENCAQFIRNTNQQARGYQGILEAQAMAYNMVIAPQINHPRVFTHTSWNTHLYTLGQNSPDGLYGALLLDGSRTYKLTGRTGDIRITLMQVFSHVLGHPDAHEIGNYDFSDFALNEDGTFEVIVSAGMHEGNWIKLNGASRYNFIMLRRFFCDYYDDMGELRIEIADNTEEYAERSGEAMAERILLASQFAAYMVKKWNIGLYDVYIGKAGGKNKLGYYGGEVISDLAGSASNNYTLGMADIALDEAIIVEQEVPNSAFWSYQIGDVWVKSLDFMHNQTDINMERAVIDSDGRFRAVIAHQDPGVPNWMNAMGFTEININGRNYKETGDVRIAAPTMKTVKFSELDRHLPSDTPRITPVQRQDNLERRRQGYIHLYDK